MSTRVNHKAMMGFVGAFAVGVMLTACGSDGDDSSDASPDASPEDCRAETAVDGSNASSSKPLEGNWQDPATAKFGETVRAEVGYGFAGETVDVTVGEPTLSTGKPRGTMGPGTPCMVKVTIVGVEDETDLDDRNFEARSADREKFDLAYMDNNLDDETIVEGQNLDTAVSYMVPKDKKIATVDMEHAGDLIATWSY